MLKKLFKLLDKSYNKKINGTGLAIFRILYSLVLLGEIFQMYYFRHLIFDKIPFIDEAEISFGIPLIFWGLSVFFIMIGLFTRYATIINYLLTVIIIGTISSYEYHMFYSYLGINFLLIFLPISQCLSIDRLIKKLKYSSARFQYNPTKNVAQLYYFLLLIIGIAFVYFDSIFFKLTSYNWMNGLGMWIPANLPMISHLDVSFIPDNEFFNKFLGYFTILFELVFLFLFWNKKFRTPFLIIGLGLHIGILLEFPIPWFALGVSGLYFTMLPVSFWKKFNWTKNKTSLAFFYDAECPLCVRTKISINHFDYFHKVEFKTVQFDANNEELLADFSEQELLDNIFSIDTKGKVRQGVDTYIAVFKRIWFLFPLGYILQIPGIYHIAKTVYNYIASNRNTERCTDDNCGYQIPVTPETQDNAKILQNLTLGDFKKYAFYSLFILLCFINTFNSLSTATYRVPYLKDSFVAKIIQKAYQPVTSFNKTFFGITQHGVFMDSHFKGYNHIISLYYLDKNNQEIRLPIIKEDGTPDYYIYSFNWIKWTFRTNGPQINQKSLAKGLRDFTAFWAHKNHVNLKDAKFILKVKKTDIPTEWEANFFDKQSKRPWIDGGSVQWNNQVFDASGIKDIEKL